MSVRTGDGISTPILAPVCELGPHEAASTGSRMASPRGLLVEGHRADGSGSPSPTSSVRCSIYPIIDPEGNARGFTPGVLGRARYRSPRPLCRSSRFTRVKASRSLDTTENSSGRRLYLVRGHESFPAYAFGQARRVFDRAIRASGAERGADRRAQPRPARACHSDCALAQDGQFRRAGDVFATRPTSRARHHGSTRCSCPRSRSKWRARGASGFGPADDRARAHRSRTGDRDSACRRRPCVQL